MSANERRAEIMKILIARRKENMQNLAREFDVTDRTIRNDILALTVDYPLETCRGNGGGVKLADWYYPHKNLFSMEQIKVLQDLVAVSNEHQKEVLEGLLRAYGRCQYQTLVK